MKLFMSFAVAFALVAITSIGCSDKSSATKKTTVSTPDGTTEKTVTTEIEKSGSNPPPVR